MNGTSRKKAIRTALISGAASAWLIYDMATASEAPGTALMLLQYGLLAMALIGLFGSVAMLARGKAEG